MSCSQRDELERFLAGELTPEEEAQFASHLADCPECCEAMAQLLETPSPGLEQSPAYAALTDLEPPAGFEETVIRELLRRKQREFRRYCMRVAVSGAAAIAIVFFSGANTAWERSAPEITEPVSVSDRIRQKEAFAKAVREFSLSDFCMEVLTHAKEK